MQSSGKAKLKFGDIIINHWASEQNPHRKGIVVRADSKTVYCTDGNGSFWNVVNDKESKTEKVGNILAQSPQSKDVEAKEAIEGKADLIEEAKDLIIRLFPPEEYGENNDVGRLYELIDELAAPYKSNEAGLLEALEDLVRACKGEGLKWNEIKWAEKAIETYKLIIKK